MSGLFVYATKCPRCGETVFSGMDRSSRRRQWYADHLGRWHACGPRERSLGADTMLRREGLLGEPPVR